MKSTNILLLAIIALLLVTVFQWRKIKQIEAQPPVIIDTVVEYIEIHDTLVQPGKIKFIKGETDTLWLTEIEYMPDPEHERLLQQYMVLGNKHFTRNSFETSFPVGEYGSAIIRDTVLENKLVGSSMELDIKVPTKIVTVRQPAPLVKQFYIGTSISGDKEEFVNSVNVGGLYKDKKDRIFGASVGFNEAGRLQYGISSYIKIK
jgi:hypothetical protein